jgi:hypothetical protein
LTPKPERLADVHVDSRKDNRALRHGAQSVSPLLLQHELSIAECMQAASLWRVDGETVMQAGFGKEVILPRAHLGSRVSALPKREGRYFVLCTPA